MALHSSSQSVTSIYRCFYAIRFSPEVVDYLWTLMGELAAHGANVRWVARRNLHLTLRFLGDLSEPQYRRALEFEPGRLTISDVRIRAEGLGAFPTLRAPRVIWSGVSGETAESMDHVRSLQKRAERHSGAIGLPAEKRSWTPHVTLARVGSAAPGLRRLVDDITTRECLSPLCLIDAVVLMQSTLSQAGAEYRVVREWRIGSSE